jgi:Putative prokaryotic signal transducing protein
MTDLKRVLAGDPDELVTVEEFAEPVEAQMAKGALESAGIECFLQGENSNSLLGAAFLARLQVHRKDEVVALEILGAGVEDLTDGEESLDDRA